jgi:hypothetical protein
MKHKPKLVGSLLIGLAAAMLPAVATAQERPRHFLDLISAIDKIEPVTLESLEGLIGRHLQCQHFPDGPIDCDDRQGLNVSDVKVGRIDFRLGAKRGSILILEDLAGDCVRLADLDVRFGKGQIMQHCADATCYGSVHLRSWGQLVANMGDNWAAECARSITLSVPY